MHSSVTLVAALAFSSVTSAQIGGSGKLGPLAPDKDTVLNTAWNKGVFEFTEIKIPKGVTVTLLGPNPAFLYSKGKVAIAGELRADGQNGVWSSLGG